MVVREDEAVFADDEAGTGRLRLRLPLLPAPSPALLLAIDCADEEGARSRRDAITMPTKSEAVIARST